mgnify:CR=1 FL=1
MALNHEGLCPGARGDKTGVAMLDRHEKMQRLEALISEDSCFDFCKSWVVAKGFTKLNGVSG